MRVIAGIVAVTIVGGCAQIRSTSTVRVVRQPGPPLVFGGPGGEITTRGAEVEWEQHSSTLEVRVHETRLCREVKHHPVTRIEHVDRKPPAALIWEYGVGAVALGVGLAALISPELFSPDAIDSQGVPHKDTTTGFRLGGVFTALGAAFIGVGIYDTARSRDSTYETQAYEVELGERIACDTPRVPMRDAEVEVSVGEWSKTVRTNSDGLATFALPPDLDVEVESEPFTPAPIVEGRGAPEVGAVPAKDDRRDGTIRIDRNAAAFELAVPYSSAQAVGKATLRPTRR